MLGTRKAGNRITHSQAISSQPYSSVIIEQYRGPLLRTTAGEAMPVQRTDPYLSHSQPRNIELPQYDSDTLIDYPLTAAKRGLSWIIFAFALSFVVFISSKSFTHDSAMMSLIGIISLVCAFAIPILTVCALVNGVEAVRDARPTAHRTLSRILGAAVAIISGPCLLLMIYVLFWFAIQLARIS